MLLLEISGQISLETVKVTLRSYEALSREQGYFGPITNLINYDDSFPETGAAAGEWTRRVLSGTKPDFTKFPKPNGHIREYESNPGVWLFTDSTGIRFLVFSDEHRKNAFKGTSIEMWLPKHLWMGEHQAEPLRGDKVDEIGGGVVDHAIAKAIRRLYAKLMELGK